MADPILSSVDARVRAAREEVLRRMGVPCSQRTTCAACASRIAELDELISAVRSQATRDAAQLSAFDAPRSCPGYCNEFTIEGRCRHTTEVRDG
jgi:hypothetical protein